MPQRLEDLPRLVYRASQFSDYSSLILQALILLALLIILSRATAIRNLLKSFLNKEKDNENSSQASVNHDAPAPTFASTALSSDDDIPEELLVAILTAAIHAYEFEQLTIDPVAKEEIRKSDEDITAIETTAPFVIKSIRRVS